MREDLMQKILFTVLRNSQRATPVKTGTLRRSETTRMEAQGTRGFIGTNVKYAGFVHDGTKYMEARPFFKEGIEDSKSEVEKLAKKAGEAWFNNVAQG